MQWDDEHWGAVGRGSMGLKCNGTMQRLIDSDEMLLVKQENAMVQKRRKEDRKARLVLQYKR